MIDLKDSPLGKKSAHIDTYTPSLLFPIPRKNKRDDLHLKEKLPFDGIDIWNAYEISWLNPKGKPIIAVGEFLVPCTSSNIFEAKSFKLYLNSFNQSKFASQEEVQALMQKDLSQAINAPIKITLKNPLAEKGETIQDFTGICLDDLDVEVSSYHPDPNTLKTDTTLAEETLYSHLLRSNCLGTGQPDWGSVSIYYKGPQINHANLLKYIISFRHHIEFHEHCMERMFVDILSRCHPEKLSVTGRYTRRGGIDLNPFRSNFSLSTPNIRLIRQ